MLKPKSLFLSDADEVCRRADDDILSLHHLHAPVEGELISRYPRPFRNVWVTMLLAFALAFGAILPTVAGQGHDASSPFTIVLFMCVWKRPLLTDFVLSHYQSLQERLAGDGIHLDLFITGSENTTAATAKKFKAAYAVHPNSPLGLKHDKGLQSLRDVYMSAVERRDRLYPPHAVAIVGSDDVINAQFFIHVRALMHGPPPRHHVVGLRDIYFYDLKSRRLVYTRGYRSFKTPISGTLGCGRVFSWSMLDTLNWHLWDLDRERGLDQSAIRNVMKTVPFVADVSEAIAGREAGIVAVDIKSDGYAAGANIWKFDQVVEAVGKSGRLHDFVDYDAEAMLGHAFDSRFLPRLEELRAKMVQFESE